MGVVTEKKEREIIKCPWVTVVDPRNIIVMKNVVLRGVCEDGSPVIQVPGQDQQRDPKGLTKALILEKNSGWRILQQTQSKKGDKK
ncbi:MAG: hypothetical protein PHW01_04205 [Patescibacteria group bacterium]|nr:hypothetical protein [Patescibacteria group bacterium]